MKIDTKLRYITPADGNVFADLGFDPGEAAALMAESDRIIVEKLAKEDELSSENPSKETDLESLKKSLLERLDQRSIE